MLQKFGKFGAFLEVLCEALRGLQGRPVLLLLHDVWNTMHEIGQNCGLGTHQLLQTASIGASQQLDEMDVARCSATLPTCTP